MSLWGKASFGLQPGAGPLFLVRNSSSWFLGSLSFRLFSLLHTGLESGLGMAVGLAGLSFLQGALGFCDGGCSLHASGFDLLITSLPDLRCTIHGAVWACLLPKQLLTAVHSPPPSWGPEPHSWCSSRRAVLAAECLLAPGSALSVSSGALRKAGGHSGQLSPRSLCSLAAARAGATAHAGACSVVALCGGLCFCSGLVFTQGGPCLSARVWAHVWA